MICGSSSRHVDNGEGLLTEVRDYNNKQVELRLKGGECKFMAKEGRWNTRFQNCPSAEVHAFESKLLQLEDQSDKLDQEIDKLERQYLAKIAKLLILSQVHCDIKTDINSQFDKLGVSVKVMERELTEEEKDLHGDGDQSFGAHNAS